MTHHIKPDDGPQLMDPIDLLAELGEWVESVAEAYKKEQDEDRRHLLGKMGSLLDEAYEKASEAFDIKEMV